MTFVEPAVAQVNPQVKILSRDGIPQALDEIRDGGLQKATVATPPEAWIGYSVVDDLSRAILGLDPNGIVVPTRLIDSSNVGESNADIAPEYDDFQDAYRKLWGLSSTRFRAGCGKSARRTRPAPRTIACEEAHDHLVRGAPRRWLIPHPVPARVGPSRTKSFVERYALVGLFVLAFAICRAVPARVQVDGHRFGDDQLAGHRPVAGTGRHHRTTDRGLRPRRSRRDGDQCV